jgi:cell division protein FtsB
MNKIARSNRKEDVRREHAWQRRGGSNVHTFLSVNQTLLERLEAENAQLRASVVELMLETRALRDGAK